MALGGIGPIAARESGGVRAVGGAAVRPPGDLTELFRKRCQFQPQKGEDRMIQLSDQTVFQDILAGAGASQVKVSW